MNVQISLSFYFMWVCVRNLRICVVGEYSEISVHYWLLKATAQVNLEESLGCALLIKFVPAHFYIVRIFIRFVIVLKSELVNRYVYQNLKNVMKS